MIWTKNPLEIYIDNISVLKIINNNMSTIDQTYHIDVYYFIIKYWREDGNITMEHITGVIYPSNDSTKHLDYVLHN